MSCRRYRREFESATNCILLAACSKENPKFFVRSVEGDHDQLKRMHDVATCRKMRWWWNRTIESFHLRAVSRRAWFQFLVTSISFPRFVVMQNVQSILMKSFKVYRWDFLVQVVWESLYDYCRRGPFAVRTRTGSYWEGFWYPSISVLAALEQLTCGQLPPFYDVRSPVAVIVNDSTQWSLKKLLVRVVRGFKRLGTVVSPIPNAIS